MSGALTLGCQKHFSGRKEEMYYGKYLESMILVNTGRGHEDPRTSSINVAGIQIYSKPLAILAQRT
jgi:hypothetical protein